MDNAYEKIWKWYNLSLRSKESFTKTCEKWVATHRSSATFPEREIHSCESDGWTICNGSSLRFPTMILLFWKIANASFDLRRYTTVSELLSLSLRTPFENNKWKARIQIVSKNVNVSATAKMLLIYPVFFIHPIFLETRYTILLNV